jgi:alpha-galactosidase
MMGWFSLMQDPGTWTAEQTQAAKKEFEFYKSDLRPLIRDADLYHVSERPDGVHWDGIEYFDAQKSRGALYAFRGSGTESTHVFVLQGLSPETRYRLHFRDGSSPDAELLGRVLMKKGLRLNLPLANSSEIVLIRDVSH